MQLFLPGQTALGWLSKPSIVSRVDFDPFLELFETPVFFFLKLRKIGTTNNFEGILGSSKGIRIQENILIVNLN